VSERSLADLRWSDHRSALWWLGLLYRRPHRFREALEQLSLARALLAGLTIFGHALPYVPVIAGIFRWVLLGELGLSPREPLILFHLRLLLLGIARGIALGIAGGILFGIAGIAEGIAEGIARGIAVGIAGGIAGAIALGIAVGIDLETAEGIAGAIAFGIAVGIALGTAGGIAGAVGITEGIMFGFGLGTAGGVLFGIAGIAFGIAVGITLLRAYYQPMHVWFIWPAVQARWYRFHPVAWDDLCLLPFPGLHRLLVAYFELSPEAGFAEIVRLISYSSQHMQVFRAETTALARIAGEERDLSRIDERVAALPSGAKGFLAQTPRVQKMVGEIAGLQRRLDAIDRPVLREPYATVVVKEIENFRGRVAGFPEPLGSEFRDAADRWLLVAQRQLREVKSVTGKEPTPQLFRAGDPVDRAHEAFVPRMGVLGQLERQVMLATGCPGLLIYGRRRMGKSTLLRNLDGFLPPSVRIVSISMLNPAAFTSVSSFAELLANGVAGGRPPPGTWGAGGYGEGPWGGTSQPDSLSTSLTDLFQILDEANNLLESDDKRLILAFDEFEQFDSKIGAGVFNLDLLSSIRESVQTHRRLIWVFAGSHHITELKHASWVPREPTYGRGPAV
jgi:hypothetical protein